jgi:serine protease Do
MPQGRPFSVFLALLLATSVQAAPDDEGRYPSDFREVIRKATDQVFPAVVYVKCVRETHAEGKKASAEVSGSGVIITPGGELLTNWHVVEKAVEVRCLLHDGAPFDAEIVGSDKDTDLALLRLKRPPGAPPLPYAELGESSALREGDFVMAMGAPWGMARSVTIGIIAATGRYLPNHSEYSLWLQTDASISPGNSGGPLVNTEGRVVGINTRAIMWGGDIGFSVPSETVRIIAARVREYGSAQWSWTGLKLQPLKDFDRNTYFDATDGVIVSGTERESPARRAGVQPRDRILRIGDAQVTAGTHEDLPAVRRRLGMLPVGKSIELAVVRDNQTIELDFTPREKGKVEGEELDCPRWDFTVKTVNRFDNPDLFFHRKKGVFVYGLREPGNATGSGLRKNDILLKIDGTAVTTLDEVRRLHEKALEDIGKKHRIALTVLRDGLMRHVVLDFSRDYEKEE